MNTTSDDSNYRWLILATVTLGLIISNGLAIGGIPVFSRPIQTEFIASGIISADTAQSFIANASVITFLMSGVSSLVGAWTLRWIPLKLAMLVGAAMLGAGFVLHSYAASVSVVYLSRFLMGTSLGFVGVTPSVVLVTNWFEARRGAALGILLTGTSIGGFVMPIVFARAIESYGWRTAMLLVSGAVWLVLLPSILIFVRDARRDNAGDGIEDADGMLLSEAVLTARFWIFAFAAALIFYTIFVTTQQFILYLQSPAIGLSLGVAAWLQSILFALSVSGKTAAGLLSDRFPARRVMVWAALLMFVATLVLWLAGAPLLFLLLYGSGYGGSFVLLQRLVSDYFGRRDYARILGTITLIEILGGVAGGRITGYLADRNGGDYSTAFYLLILVTAVITVCMYTLGREKAAA
jgi:MFS family permease